MAKGCNLVLPSCDKVLSVLLIDDNPARAEIVESGLRDAGYVLLERLEDTYDLSARVDTLKPDVIVVSTDSPTRDVIEDRRRPTEKQPRPIALFADGSDPATIAAARQRRVVGTLATIERRAMRVSLDGPTLCVVGEVIGLAMAQTGPERRRNFSLSRESVSDTTLCDINTTIQGPGCGYT